MDLRKRFTKWYFRRKYIFCYIKDDRDGHLTAKWFCPWWVKLLLIFFSPSVYFEEFNREFLSKGIVEGFESIRKVRRITGKISAILGNFDYMAHWGALKTREELIGKPVKYDVGDVGEKVSVGTIVDCDPTTDEWWAELYV